MSGTMLFICSIVILGLAERTKGQGCPAEYKRYSEQHSFCLSPNPTCNILARGVNGKDKQTILKAHNTYRNKVATGNEERAGGLPTASNMMQLFWDDDLAAIAQKWAENCVYGHDCNECRAVDDFPVGENIFKSWYTCTKNPCDTKNDWNALIQSWYDEVKDFNQERINQFGPPPPGKTTGHFTQVIWAKTWRVGCGFVAFKEGTLVTLFSVCNYGPAGNLGTNPIYIPGPPCSNCPTNTCCGSTCSEFEGLCVMKNKNVAPKYPQSTEGLIFNCDDFANSKGDCKNTVDGPGAQIKKTLSGNILSIQLKGGEETEVVFTKTFHPNSAFCFRPRFRQGPAVAGENDQSKLEANMFIDGNNDPINVDLTLPPELKHYNYVPSGVGIYVSKDVKFSLKFSVPEGAPEAIVDIVEIVAFTGPC